MRFHFELTKQKKLPFLRIENRTLWLPFKQPTTRGGGEHSDVEFDGVASG